MYSGKGKMIFKCLPLLFVFLTSVVYAEPYKIGDKLPGINLKDQHKVEHNVGETVRLILFTADKGGKNIIEKAIYGVGKDYLKDNNTVYIADIRGMPRLIGKLIALPKMRKLTYSILLDREQSVTKDFPSEPDKVTLIYINKYNIQEIEIVDTPEDVKKAIEKDRP